jgi:hypothetical protein
LQKLQRDIITFEGKQHISEKLQPVDVDADGDADSRTPEGGFELRVSPETAALDYDARRNALSAEATGEAALVAEPMESLLWYVQSDPELEGEEGAARLVKAAAEL